MSNLRSTTWSYRVEVDPRDKVNLRGFIAQELAYYNSLIEGLSGPSRTMPETVRAFTGRMEQLFGEVAASRTHPRDLKVDNLPDHFKRFSDLLFADGKFILDARSCVVLDVAAGLGAIHPDVRRAMALAMIAEAREQAAAFATSGDSFRYLQVVTPLDSRSKRHAQMPKSAVTSVEVNGSLGLKLPYLKRPLLIPIPPVQWNYVVLREDDDGKHTLELSQVTEGYLLRRADSSGFRRKQKRGDHRGQYSMPVEGR